MAIHQSMFSSLIGALLTNGLALSMGCSNGESSIPVKPVESPDTLVTFTIAAVGDLMCHSTQFNYAKTGVDSFDFTPSFSLVAPILQQADLAIGNLETTLAGKARPYSGYPMFNTPDQYVRAVKQAGFDFLVTANNHSNDSGDKGIVRTISILDSIGLGHTGSFASANDRDSIRILDIKGVKIGIISYTFSTNGLPLADGKPWLVNMCDSALIKKDMAAGRAKGAELMIVFYHFGEEYQRLPNAYQKQFVQHAIDCGADVVLGSHPHVIQPMEVVAGRRSNVDSVFVAYSMGNFISNQKDQYTDEGVIMQLTFEKHLPSGKIRLAAHNNYVPTWVYRGVADQLKMHIIVPVSAAPGNDTKAIYLNDAYQSSISEAKKHTDAILHTVVPK